MPDPSERSAVFRYGIAVLAVSLALLARSFFQNATDDRAPFFFFYSAVVIATWFGGWRPGLFATVLAGVAGTWSYVSHDPASTLAPRHFVVPAVFLVLCVLMARVVSNVQSAHARLRAASDAQERANRELAEANERLRQSNEDLQRFAYATSHDLQEPLRMVGIYSELLLRENEGRLTPDSEEYAHFIQSGVHRLHALIDDILAYSRVSGGESPLAPVSSASAVAAAVRSLNAAIKESGARITCDDSLPEVLAEERRLSLVFQNLLSNAIKYRGRGAPTIHVSAIRCGETWTFGVTDDGIGIDPKYHEQIFGLFQRLHAADEYPGTGIGLAITKRIVEQFGGRIWVESRVGAGATFRFTVGAVPSPQYE